MSSTEATSPKPTGEAKALMKGIAILDALADHGELSLADVTHVADVTKATAHRLLASLAEAGLVRHLPGGRYGLGSHCLLLADAFLDGVDLRAEAAPVMRTVVERTAETCHLGVLSGEHIVYIEKLDSPHPVRMYSRVGAANPATTTALGRAILAFSPAEVVDMVYGTPIPRRTANTVTDSEEAHRRLLDVRRHGYAVDDVENEEGIRCIAAPILDHRGEATGGLSVSGPEHRVSPDRVPQIGEAVRDAAEAISRQIGYREPFPGVSEPPTRSAA